MDPKIGQFKFGKNHQKNDNEKHDLLSKNPIRTHKWKLVKKTLKKHDGQLSKNKNSNPHPEILLHSQLSTSRVVTHHIKQYQIKFIQSKLLN